MFYLNWQLGLIAAIVTILAWLVSKKMNKVSLREAASRQEQSERLTDAVLSFVEDTIILIRSLHPIKMRFTQSAKKQMQRTIPRWDT